ncbi:type II secretion system protein [Camelimonas fluminis]|uniref:Type II secretion system F family protein n=1 Tax=Camelimonas fluminis TaxID=1576911 RepID=A0ABV7UH25_9HYPH|nr:type II secretion system F family protein [Camelimonas fluminis]GHE73154.1 type II secretion system protein [Camelimonas fluminis]
MNEAIIGIFIVVAIAAILANYLPSLTRREVAARRLAEVIDAGRNDGAIKRPSTHSQFIENLSAYAVQRLQLHNHLSPKDFREKLFRAGYRTESAETIFLFARFCSPIVLAIIAVTYLFGFKVVDWPPLLRVLTVIGAAFFGLKLPEIIIANTTQKRLAEFSKVWPDALDLLVILVESGMTVEVALRKVTHNISLQSRSFAAELNYLIAELSHLPNRTDAYANFAQRIPIPAVQSTTTALIQAEMSGTSVASALRTMAAESRNERMQAAKKKAAGMGPKLSMLIVLFFVPAFVTIIVVPALINAFGWK